MPNFRTPYYVNIEIPNSEVRPACKSVLLTGIS